ncbi:AMP-binding protein [Nonomuraea sp. NPDC051941]|uniref:AMP-dependent synthetase/ligase n=1 Tax=Nonomuraea sp. NPDC051941 TaxID=3364373 RepID=UPI0037C5E8FF
MRVYAVPAPRTVAPDAQLADVVFADDRVNGDMVLFQRRSAGGWRRVTARQFAADVRSLAAGFLSAGIRPGDRVALLAATSYKWTLVDYALWTVYRRLRAALGGRVGYAISGGAPLGARLGHFLRGIGITVLEGYGMTETSAAATVNLPYALKIGTVGPPLPGVEIRIADDCEILIKGPILFQGYWRNEQATRESQTADGWLRTGDLGAVDEDGFLTISGHMKEIIVTAGGKNLAPEALEDRLRTHPLISQAVVVGDRRPYTAALITLDAAALSSWKRAVGRPEQAGPAELRDDPDLLARLQTAVDEANTAVSRAESIRRFRILPVDLTEQNGYLTPTLKVKRALVHKDFAADIEELYR